MAYTPCVRLEAARLQRDQGVVPEHPILPNTTGLHYSCEVTQVSSVQCAKVLRIY